MSGAQHNGDNAPKLPSGVLTVMFTDLENSTPRWELEPREMRRVMDVHDEVLARAVNAQNGVVFKSTGDGIGAVFTSPRGAVEAAIAVQRQLQMVPWPSERPRVRIGLHLGDLTPTRGDYYGTDVNRAARIMDVANGDQIAVSGAVAAFVDPDRWIACGEHQLRGVGTESIHLIRDSKIRNDERPLRAKEVSRTKRLPSSTSRSIGRSEELDDVLSMLSEKRSVTIVGPGGVGKTHLALEVGRNIETSFADGAVLIELAALRDEAAVLDTVAAALGARVQPGLDLLESVLDYLEARRLLIILDNCEHVTPTASALVAQFVREAGVTVLATSRSPLRCHAEQVFPLSPLQAETDAADLFVERAIERDPTFNPNPSERSMIELICERVDGIPLGIELAAAWVRVLTPGEISRRLVGTFEIGGSVEGARQETLRSTIQWSYAELDDRESALFDRLSVFASGFSLGAATEVCSDGALIDSNDVADLLVALVDKSMVMTERIDGQVRFSMLRTLQHFASEQLGESLEADQFRLAHAAYFGRLAATASSDLISEREPEVWELLELEWANIRAAFRVLLESGKLQEASDMLLDLGWFSTLSLRSETFAWAEDLLATPGVHALKAVSSLHGLRAINKYFSVDADSRTDAEAGLRIDSTDPHGYCRIALGAVWLKNQHEGQESDGWTRAWLESLTATSPMMSQLWARGMRAFHLCVHEPLSGDAEERVSEIEAIASTTGSASASALAHWARGMYIASVREATVGWTDDDQISSGLEQWHRGLDVAGSLSDLHLISQLLIGLELHFTAPAGDIDTALRTCRDALDAAHEHHYLAGTSHLFGVTAIVLARVGQVAIAERLVPVMVANGHVPRQNTLDALGIAAPIGSSIGSAGVLSIHEAAALARAALTQAIGESTRREN